MNVFPSGIIAVQRLKIEEGSDIIKIKRFFVGGTGYGYVQCDKDRN